MPPGCHQLHEYVDIFRHIQHASDASLKKNRRLLVLPSSRAAMSLAMQQISAALASA
jgi:hypothetical protein